MKKMKSNYTQILAVIIALGMVFFTGCDSTDSTPEMGTLEVRLFDAPADYDEVNIFVERVEVNNTEGDEGWEVISEPMQSYNLLELTNGVFEVIADAELEAGLYPQIRLVLSRDENSVVIDGESHGLFVPSGTETGVKLNVDAEIEADMTYTLLVDFDALRSVVKTGQAPTPGYILKPVIRTANLVETGNIGGVVEPFNARAVVYAIAGDDTLSTTFADTDTGEFLLVGLEGGLYDVSVEAREEGYLPAELSDVEVVTGETNDVGTIVLDTEE